jgi:enoyl-CoA hydratase
MLLIAKQGKRRMAEKTVKLATPAPYVAVVTLDRPPVNALSRALREELVETIAVLQERSDVRVIILTASGEVFCAGADIKEKHALAAGEWDQTQANRLTQDVFFTIFDSRKPVIAAVNGAALGAGFVLAACCDMILAAEKAFFAMPEIDVGLGGGASFLQRILPTSKMRRMMLTGERVPALELHRLGVVEECVPGEDLMPAALKVATVIASKSPVAVQTIRTSFATIEGLDPHEGFRVEQIYTTELSKSAEAKEARQAFLEKRKPKFQS